MQIRRHLRVGSVQLRSCLFPPAQFIGQLRGMGEQPLNKRGSRYAAGGGKGLRRHYARAGSMLARYLGCKALDRIDSIQALFPAMRELSLWKLIGNVTPERLSVARSIVQRFALAGDGAFLAGFTLLGKVAQPLARIQGVLGAVIPRTVGFTWPTGNHHPVELKERRWIRLALPNPARLTICFCFDEEGAPDILGNLSPARLQPRLGVLRFLLCLFRRLEECHKLVGKVSDISFDLPCQDR